jgi:hypothetical protein
LKKKLIKDQFNCLNNLIRVFILNSEPKDISVIKKPCHKCLTIGGAASGPVAIFNNGLVGASRNCSSCQEVRYQVLIITKEWGAGVLRTDCSELKVQ